MLKYTELSVSLLPSQSPLFMYLDQTRFSTQGPFVHWPKGWQKKVVVVNILLAGDGTPQPWHQPNPKVPCDECIHSDVLTQPSGGTAAGSTIQAISSATPQPLLDISQELPSILRSSLRTASPTLPSSLNILIPCHFLKVTQYLKKKKKRKKIN